MVSGFRLWNLASPDEWETLIVFGSSDEGPWRRRRGYCRVNTREGGVATSTDGGETILQPCLSRYALTRSFEAEDSCGREKEFCGPDNFTQNSHHTASCRIHTNHRDRWLLAWDSKQWWQGGPFGSAGRSAGCSPSFCLTCTAATIIEIQHC